MSASRLRYAFPLLAVLLAQVLASSALATDTPIIAFGDSITEGYGDDPESTHPGYPPRLEGLLGDAGFPVAIANWGVGGETTAEGLSRIDDALDDGGEILLLMEGTNDINRLISGETIRYNLNAMAAKAEARGIKVVHATVIPHRPDGTGDIENFATRDVQLDILHLAENQGRKVVDAFAAFWDEPDFFSRFYLDDPPEEDPVGHPNPAGYDLLAEAFLPVVRDVLASGSGSGQIQVLTQPILAGQIASFGVDLRGSFTSVVWRFGSDGWADGQAEEGYSADFVFDRPGTFRVTVEATDAAGRVISSHLDVVVQGSIPTWRTSRSLVALARRTHPAPGGSRRTTELRLTNLGATSVRTEIELLAPPFSPRELEVRAASTPIAVGLRPGQTVLLADVLAALGVSEGSAALRVTARAASGSMAPQVEAAARLLTNDAAGERSEAIVGIPESAWSTGARFVGGIDGAFGTAGALVLANPESQAASVDLELFDPAGLPLASGTLSVPASSTLQRSLTLLFPSALTGPGPFGLRVNADRKVVAGLEAAASTDAERSFVPVPVQGTLTDTLYLPTMGSGGDGFTRRLAVFNPGVAPLQLRFALLRLGAVNTSPPVADRTVAAGGSLVLENLRTQLFGQSGDGVGMIRVTWSGAGGVAPVLFGSAASSVGPAGVLGYTVRASPTEGVFYDTALLPLPPPSSSWAPVIGLMELESFAVTVRVELLDMLGETLAVRNVQLLRRELDEPTLAGLFPNLLGTGWGVRLTLPDGGAVIAYLASRSPAGDLEVTAATIVATP